jgi:hypothetical protein
LTSLRSGRAFKKPSSQHHGLLSRQGRLVLRTRFTGFEGNPSHSECWFQKKFRSSLASNQNGVILRKTTWHFLGSKSCPTCSCNFLEER